uniref:BTB domain-containing protein n=1 Tax=Fusarium oxysporum (strain Fo5176) TaxID=660025 RepID=A0A0D2XY79_FUSOF
MSNTRIEIDPEGDTLIILPVKPASTQSEGPDHPIEKHFLCSKKHLTLASRRAAKLFSSQFKEASVESDGLYHWKFEGIFNAEAFELVLKIIHGKTRDVPRNVKLDLLADIATIVDDLECHEAVAFFSTNWLLGWPVGWPSTEELRDKPLAQLILASFVFEHASLFKTSTKMAIRHNIDVISTYELPIRADVSDKVGCNEACRAMLLGSLLQAMKKLELYPRPSSPFPKLSLDNLLASLAKVQSPAYFGPKSQGLVLNSSGKWNLETTPLVAGGLFGNRSDQSGPTQSPASGGLFGNSPDPQSTNTTQDTRKFGGIPQTPSSPFGTPFSQSSNIPRETIGLFGNKASSSVVKPPLVESEEQPATLVKHNCRLKGLIDPLINAAEKEITGLKLADFPRP